MRFGATILVAALAFSSCHSSGPSSYYVPKMEIDRDGHLIPVGTISLFQPVDGSFYHFFHAATGFTSVSRMETKSGVPQLQTTLFLATNRNQELDEMAKSDILVAGDFGLVSAQRTCFYHRPVESSYNSVSVTLHSNEYLSAFEIPTVLAKAPAATPPFTSISLVRVLRGDSDYMLISSDYEANGDLRNFQIMRAKNGQISPQPDELTYRAGLKDPRLDKYSIPSSLDIDKFRSTHRLHLSRGPLPEESFWVIQFYDFGKLIQIQQFKGDVAISSRWLEPSVTEDEREIGPECDARFAQQRALGLPTAGY